MAHWPDSWSVICAGLGLGSATVMLLTIRAQDAVEAGPGCQIPPLIGQFWHDLAWGQTAKFL